MRCGTWLCYKCSRCVCERCSGGVEVEEELWECGHCLNSDELSEMFDDYEEDEDE